MARPKGPKKVRVLITILESAHNVFQAKAETRGVAVPTYIADFIERHAEVDSKKPQYVALHSTATDQAVEDAVTFGSEPADGVITDVITPLAGVEQLPQPVRGRVPRAVVKGHPTGDPKTCRHMFQKGTRYCGLCNTEVKK